MRNLHHRFRLVEECVRAAIVRLALDLRRPVRAEQHHARIRAALMDVGIENPAVTRKSYPRFWDDLRGFGVEEEE